MNPFAPLISPEKLRQDLRRFLELPILQDSLRSQAQAWLHVQEVTVPQTRARDALAGRHRVIEPQEVPEPLMAVLDWLEKNPLTSS